MVPPGTPQDMRHIIDEAPLELLGFEKIGEESSTPNVMIDIMPLSRRRRGPSPPVHLRRAPDPTSGAPSRARTRLTPPPRRARAAGVARSARGGRPRPRGRGRRRPPCRSHPEGEGIPPVFEAPEGRGHRRLAALGVAHPGGSAQVQELPLARRRRGPTLSGLRVEVVRRAPERRERPGGRGVVPDARADRTAGSADSAHLGESGHQIGNEVRRDWAAPHRRRHRGTAVCSARPSRACTSGIRLRPPRRTGRRVDRRDLAGPGRRTS